MIFSKRSHTLVFAAGILLTVTLVVDRDEGVTLPLSAATGVEEEEPTTTTSLTAPAARPVSTPATDDGPPVEEVFVEASEVDQWGAPSDTAQPMLSALPEIEAPMSTEPEMEAIDYSYGRPMAEAVPNADF